MKDARLHVVLVHGAGLGGWIWREVQALLDMPSTAVDFPRRAEPAEARAALTFGDYVSDVARQVDRAETHRVVVVAHSIGGVVGLALAQRLGVRLAGFVGVAAAIPVAGGSYLSTLPKPQALVTRVVTRLFGTRPPTAAIRTSLCNDLDPQAASDVVERFAAESRRLYTTPCEATVPDVPRLYVRTTDDREASPAQQDRMAANLGAATTDIATGHLPMLASPAGLARLLNGFTGSAVLV